MKRLTSRKLNAEENLNYLASVSDLVAGLLFVFIVFLFIFALQFSMAKTELVNTYSLRKILLNQIFRYLEGKGLNVKVDEEHGILHLPEEVLFPFGSAQVTEDGRKVLKELAYAFKLILPCYSGSFNTECPDFCQDSCHPGRLEAIIIEGHTDNVPVSRWSPFEDNWDLSAQRAINTYKVLVQFEPSLKDLRNAEGQPLFGASGYADTRPRVPNDTPEHRALNRRIDIRFLMTPPREPTVIKRIKSKILLINGN